jgi:NAD(P)-dependent dehydrogenase (short-subunit alcohol dehydrogenase family)
MAGILEGKAALITGGASGIGRATVVAMAREGARVGVADRTQESAAATVALINAAGGQAVAIGGDVRSEADVTAMVSRTVAAFGKIDCAFNNAGISRRAVGPVGQCTHEMSRESFDAQGDCGARSREGRFGPRPGGDGARSASRAHEHVHRPGQRRPV